ncbi:hypothetical protein CLIB1423_33S00628 [[Candida] railenensis]|uniref:Uncharacterized protein n=1 Tax=[Candida] railenensis TaxID=45579 RepID=A0A9P0QVG9_9ASCO|nr:hypothetical protein CLIB1423_33S00628 [[Candida] railenensis]
MLKRTILCTALVSIATANDLASVINENPSLKSYYSELFGENWQKTVSELYSGLQYAAVASEYAAYSITGEATGITSADGVKAEASAASAGSGTASGSTTKVSGSSASTGSTSGKSATGSSTTSSSSNAGVYSVAIPVGGVLAALVALF